MFMVGDDPGLSADGHITIQPVDIKPAAGASTLRQLAKHHCPLDGTKLYLLVTETHWENNFPKVAIYVKVGLPEVEPATCRSSKSSALTTLRRRATHTIGKCP